MSLEVARISEGWRTSLFAYPDDQYAPTEHFLVRFFESVLKRDSVSLAGPPLQPQSRTPAPAKTEGNPCYTRVVGCQSFKQSRLRIHWAARIGPMTARDPNGRDRFHVGQPRGGDALTQLSQRMWSGDSSLSGWRRLIQHPMSKNGG